MKKTARIANHSDVRGLAAQNVSNARRRWAASVAQVRALRKLTFDLQLSVELGHLVLLDGRWYVTHAGLMRVAYRNRCASIQSSAVGQFCEPNSARWVFRATVFKRQKSKAFVGYGDADPSNVSPLVRGAEMRIAETRAVNRALRKAYGIGLCSVEELGWQSERPSAPAPNDHNYWVGNGTGNGNGANNGQRLRDQLCILIRKYNLDPNLVKQYAADYCGTAALKDASRELVASFISHLAESAQQNRDALICKLNSYAQSVEAKS